MTKSFVVGTYSLCDILPCGSYMIRHYQGSLRRHGYSYVLSHESVGSDVPICHVIMP